MRSENFMISIFEHEKHFIISGPGLIFFVSDCPALQLPHALIHPSTRVSHGTTVLVECYNPYFIVGQGTTTAPMTCYSRANESSKVASLRTFWCPLC